MLFANDLQCKALIINDILFMNAKKQVIRGYYSLFNRSFNVSFGRLGDKILSVFFAKNFPHYCPHYCPHKQKIGTFYHFPAVGYMVVFGVF